MDIQLNHIAHFLPYGLQAISEQTNELRLVTLIHFTYDRQTVGLNHILYEGLMIQKHKPILRPLSDLTTQMLKDCGYANLAKLLDDLVTGDMPIKIYKDLVKNLYDVDFLIDNNLAVDVKSVH